MRPQREQGIIAKPGLPNGSHMTNREDLRAFATFKPAYRQRQRQLLIGDWRIMRSCEPCTSSLYHRLPAPATARRSAGVLQRSKAAVCSLVSGAHFFIKLGLDHCVGSRLGDRIVVSSHSRGAAPTRSPSRAAAHSITAEGQAAPHPATLAPVALKGSSTARGAGHAPNRREEHFCLDIW